MCGDPWDEVPRSYEYPNGLYVRGGVPPVNKVYAAGQTLEVVIRLTKSHKVRGISVLRCWWWWW